VTPWEFTALVQHDDETGRWLVDCLAEGPDGRVVAMYATTATEKEAERMAERWEWEMRGALAAEKWRTRGLQSDV
jgi:hypothetical protein